MSRPKLVQCLCPQRHCISAIAFLNIDDEHAAAMMQAALRELLDAHRLNPWCGLCGAKAETWCYEVATLKAEWDEAVEELKASARAQCETADYLKSIGLAYDRPARMGSLN